MDAELGFNYGIGDFANPIYTFEGHLGTSNFLSDGHVKAMKPSRRGERHRDNRRARQPHQLADAG